MRRQILQLFKTTRWAIDTYFLDRRGTFLAISARVKDIKQHVRREIAAIAVPDEFEFALSLPKTRSGKIMRRVLKAKELGQDLGDLSALE